MNRELQTTGTSWFADAKAALMVSLTTLFVAIAIAKASGFPTGNSLLVAVISSIVVAFTTMKYGVSRLSIKAPSIGMVAVSLPAMQILGIEAVLAIFLSVGILQFAFSGTLKNITRYIPTGVLYGIMAGVALIILKNQVPIAFGFGTWSHMQENNAVFGIGFFVLAICVVSTCMQRVGTPIVGVPIAIAIGIVAGIAILPQHYAITQLTWAWITPNFHVVLDEPLLFVKFVAIAFLVNTIENAINTRAVNALTESNTPIYKDLRSTALISTIVSCFGGMIATTDMVSTTSNINLRTQSSRLHIVYSICLLLSVAIVIPVVLFLPVPVSVLATVVCFSAGLLLVDYLPKIHYSGLESIGVFTVTAGVVLWLGVLEGAAVGFVLETIIAMIYQRKLNIFTQPVISAEGEQTIIMLNDATFIQAPVLGDSNLSQYDKVFINVNAPYIDVTCAARLDELITSGGGVKVNFNWAEYKKTAHFVPTDKRVNPSWVAVEQN